jgi:hypothetical protein
MLKHRRAIEESQNTALCVTHEVLQSFFGVALLRAVCIAVLDKTDTT